MYQLFNCSPKAEAMLPKDFDAAIERSKDNAPMLAAKSKATKYPFARMLLGHCFVVSYSETDDKTENQLRKAASLAGQKLGRKFTVLRHNDNNMFEIARIR